MGNLPSLGETKAMPIETTFNLPSPLPSWPKSDTNGGGFGSGRINLGGLEVRQISKLQSTKWLTDSNLPHNYHVCYSQEARTGPWKKYGMNIYNLRPTSRGPQALGVSNKDTNISSCMPNKNQIEALLQTYSPVVYFHPDEPYLPSSVSWYFNNGVLLHDRGNESNPAPIDSNGMNLPQGGSSDGLYWLDLPSDKGSKVKVKRGDLHRSETCLQVKPMSGGTYTDIAIWVFYPFNGTARAKIKFINVNLGRIGEHVGDWEHLTLRISNFNGQLHSVYFSEHSKRIWVKTPELEFQDGNKPVVYSSLHGHAFYPKPGLVLQGSGLRSKTMMNTGERYEIVSTEYLGTILWTDFTRPI
ncbi:hypothetical protein MKX01_017150 [Papaver californicum]|nr:hypothetical protein MKX01_017150 [Papaver californicum]